MYIVGGYTENIVLDCENTGPRMTNYHRHVTKADLLKSITSTFEIDPISFGIDEIELNPMYIVNQT